MFRWRSWYASCWWIIWIWIGYRKRVVESSLTGTLAQWYNWHEKNGSKRVFKTRELRKVVWYVFLKSVVNVCIHGISSAQPVAPWLIRILASHGPIETHIYPVNSSLLEGLSCLYWEEEGRSQKTCFGICRDRFRTEIGIDIGAKTKKFETGSRQRFYNIFSI